MTHLLTSQALGALSCQRVFRSSKASFQVLTAEKINLSQGNTFIVRDKHEELFEFQATLNDRGVVSFSVFMAEPAIGIRSSLSGRLLFDEMISYFGLKNIRGIRGNWIEGTNYDHFFQARQNGASLTQAALSTWTGQQASRYGFTTDDSQVEVSHDRMTHQESVKVIFYLREEER